ncbi:hypothetical protein RHSIM_Rhsim01G0177900 [Rhododendron simsii]|uniref:Protein FAR1-RELATED SEQUENCE n=1 Tax=Rhododendron simsii TaxID=118357 RepID=A0A834HGU5_RHOSS|nr:hypothetical protein RHSIM_Rhsim01G0177900 [Rhododendron simsii]
MESTVSELYTLAILHKFQDKLFQIEAYMVKMTREDEHYCFYIVERAKVNGSRVRNLLVNKSSEHVSFSCKLFECNGIPCRYLLAYFNRMQFLDLPHERNELFKLTSSVIDDAILTENGSELLEEALCLVQNKLYAMNLGSECGKLSDSQVSIPREHTFKEPLQVRASGCGKRLKGGKEKAVKKSRHWNGCGLTRKSHDK